MKYYAILDNENIVIGIKSTLYIYNEPNMIEINLHDINLMGMKYLNGEFIEVGEENENTL